MNPSYYEIMLANGTVVVADQVHEVTDSGSLELRKSLGGQFTKHIATLAPHTWLAYRWVAE